LSPVRALKMVVLPELARPMTAVFMVAISPGVVPPKRDYLAGGYGFR
jgi:hypothetical protein